MSCCCICKIGLPKEIDMCSLCFDNYFKDVVVENILVQTTHDLTERYAINIRSRNCHSKRGKSSTRRTKKSLRFAENLETIVTYIDCPYKKPQRQRKPIRKKRKSKRKTMTQQQFDQNQRDKLFSYIESREIENESDGFFDPDDE